MTTATDPTLAGLLWAVCLDPADDGPRLVLADWYDEHDDPRGEFVRVQVELAGLEARMAAGDWVPPPGTTRRVMALRRRERELLGPNWSLWMPDLGDVPRACGNRDAFPKSALSHSDGHVVMTFRRGFVDAVALPTQAFLDYAESLFRAQPVTRVTLSDKKPWQPGPDGSPGPSRWWPGTDWDDRGRAAAESLPGDVFDVLAGGKREGGGVVYPTPEDAVMAASAACVRFGRRKARLPALETAGRMP